MQSKSIAIQLANPVIDLSQQPIKEPNMDAVTINLMIFSIISILICVNISKIWQYSSRANPCKKIPCRRCRYFSDNPFLKCTLHPVTTLTKQAVDCRDYCPHSEARWLEK